MCAESDSSPVDAPESGPENAARHAACFACRPRADGGLGLSFRPTESGGVEAEFDCHNGYQSYPDRVHGGIVALVLDAAMTHCLFTHRVTGYTARLNIRYHRPVALDLPAVVRAWLLESRPPLFKLRAEIGQQGAACASAEAAFWGESDGEGPHASPVPA